MQEGHPRAADAPSGVLVDHLHTRLLQARQYGVDVRHLVGDVVHAGPLLGQEPAHGGVLGERRQQLHVVLTHVQKHRLDALLPYHLAVGHHQRQPVAVELERGLDLVHGDSDVVYAVEHARSL